MASLNEKLKQERELRGISLKQISDETKIGVRFLEALEENQMERIPGEFYRRSYLRAYVRYLGLDEDRAVNAYDYSKRSVAPAAGPVAPTGQELPIAGFLKWTAVALVVLTSGALVWSSVRSNGGASSETSSEGAPGTISEAAGSAIPEEPRETGEPPTRNEPHEPSALERARDTLKAPADARPVSRPTAGSGMLRLVITVEEACWLEVMADGEVAAEGLKPHGFTQEIYADDEIRLWLGNAGGVSLSINDRALKPLGRPGQVRKDLTITPDNFHEFVASADLAQ